MADNSTLVWWLNHRISTLTTAVPVAIYEGLRARIERGDFDRPHGAEPPHQTCAVCHEHGDHVAYDDVHQQVRCLRHLDTTPPRPRTAHPVTPAPR